MSADFANTLARDLIGRLHHASPTFAAWQRRLLDFCAIEARDVVDHVTCEGLPGDRDSWRNLGAGAWRALDGLGPAICLRSEANVAFAAESLEALFEGARPFGAPHAPYRRARVFDGGGVAGLGVERRGEGFALAAPGERKLRRALIHQQLFRTRPRHFRSSDTAFAHLDRMVATAVADLGASWAANLFLRAEREHWESLCPAGAVLGQRQNHIGLGWNNIAQLRYCVPRSTLAQTEALFATLGFERAGVRHVGAASWASVRLLHPWSPSIELDVDLNESEALAGAGHALDDLLWLDGPGYWCALHGDSLFEGGIRQVVARYDLGQLASLANRDGLTLTPRGGELIDAGRVAPIKHGRIDLLERQGHLDQTCGERLRLGGVRVSRLCAIASGAPPPLPQAEDLPVFDCAKAQALPKRTRRRLRPRLRGAI